MLINLGDLYSQDDTTTKKAIKCYEHALKSIKELPRSNDYRENIKTYLVTLQNLYNKDGQSYKADEIDIELARQRRFAFIYQ